MSPGTRPEPEPHYHPRMPTSPLIDHVTSTLRAWPGLRLAIVFGSVAAGTESSHSDVDVAVLSDAALTLDERLRLVAALADATGRAVDLVDLARVGEPLLGQVLRGGVRVLGEPALHAQVLSRYLLDAADFGSLIERLQRERRRAWIGR